MDGFDDAKDYFNALIFLGIAVAASAIWVWLNVSKRIKSSVHPDEGADPSISITFLSIFSFLFLIMFLNVFFPRQVNLFLKYKKKFEDWTDRQSDKYLKPFADKYINPYLPNFGELHENYLSQRERDFELRYNAK